MISKILVLTALVASSVAGPQEHHEATSFAHFNDNHNSVHHIQSAPQSYYHKPSPQVYHAAAPQQQYHQVHQQQYHQAPQQQYHQLPQQQYHQVHQQQYRQAPSVAHYAAAPVTKVAAPVAHYKVAPITKVVAPVAHYAPAPVAHYAPAPVAKVVAPVAHYSSAPSYNHYKHEEQYPDAHPKYEFTYLIEDAHTGDYHSQQEQRDGDHVVGQYSLHEADGTVRIVKYSDEGHGFNAVVERQGHPTDAPQQYKKVVVPVAAPQYEHHY